MVEPRSIKLNSLLMLSQEEVLELTKLVFKEEVNVALIGMGSFKSPRVDGFYPTIFDSFCHGF